MMNKASKENEVNASEIGRFFLTKYYNAMAHGVEQVIHFYSDSSNVKRFGKPPVNGLENIKTELAKHRLDNVNVRVAKVICLNSLSDSIIIQVSGEFVQTSGDARPYIQNIVLALQSPGRYYVYSDMIEWLDELFPNLPALQQLQIGGGANAGVEQPAYNGQKVAPKLSADSSTHPHASDSSSIHSEIHQNGHPQQRATQSPQYDVYAGTVPPTQHSGHPQGQNVGNIHSFINAVAPSVQAPPPQLAKQREREPEQQGERFVKKEGQFQERQPPQAKEQTPDAAPKRLDFETIQAQERAKQAQQQQQALQSAQIPEDTGPRTWAKLVSGQIKSNGLPPPTQPPPATLEQFQTMDKKIKTQPELHQQKIGGGGGERREGGNKGGFNRRYGDGENRQGRGSGSYGKRDGEQRGGGGGERGERREGGEDRPYRPRRQPQNDNGDNPRNNSDRPPRKFNNNGPRDGGEGGGPRPRGDNYNKDRQSNPRPYRQQNAQQSQQGGGGETART